MSLSKAIIYGEESDVAKFIKAQPTVDEIDEYGYTPLVQATIVNSVEKAKQVIDAGADVNFPDLTGRTPLHWATDNNNMALTELLLEHKADPNAYSRASQPVLVYPHLREQYPIKQLLYKYGGNLDFARDFINAKSLGHRFELEGRVDIVTPQNVFIEVEFEGFYSEFSLASILNSLIDFQRHFGGKHLRHHFEKLQRVTMAFQRASQLLQYQHYLIKKEEVAKDIDALLSHSLRVIPIAFAGHAICFIQMGKWLIRCDRGQFGVENGCVILYRIGKPLLFNHDFIRKLLYKRQHKDFIDDAMIQLLQLKQVTTLPISPQLTGNCSWSNIEAALPAAMYLLQLEENNQSGVLDFESPKADALGFHQEWLTWDKRRELHFCLESLRDASKARKASKAAIIAAILYQRTDYSNDKDVRQAEKILTAFQDPEYHYILASYVEVFTHKNPTEQIKSFMAFLDDHGIDYKKMKAGKK